VTTDVGQALEVITTALAGMALLIALLVLTERVLLRAPAPRATAELAAEPAGVVAPAALPADAVSASAAP
jgi:hypothetical protein